MTRRTHIAGAVLALVIAAIPAAEAFASFSSNSKALHTVQSLLLQSPATASAETIDACARVAVSWANAGADGYRVQVREGSGAWTDVTTDSGPVTSIEDTAGHAGTTVTYRIFSHDSQSGWESGAATETSSVSC